ncbi:MAG: MaoC family dehydratase N-terminal domain-containing protein [Dehalococcoidia bacterium]|jgi:hypothetical protein|nr:MaoC family dehydratase N-terminal domain-containing protein [Dehalococcoidia bacterium]MDW8009313.1 MaoC family dehydratase N-terminal domain-containing protein [Chloroflexota bacterium]
MELAERVKDYIGQKAQPVPGADEVNLPMIRHWCEMVEDANPVYWDEEFARKSRFGRLISPPTMLHTWLFARWWQPDYLRQERGQDPLGVIYRTAEEMGYTANIAVSNEAEYLEPYGPEAGRIIGVRYISEVSPEKATRLGRGVFLTIVTECYTENDNRLVGINRMVLFKYRPNSGSGGQ